MPPRTAQPDQVLQFFEFDKALFSENEFGRALTAVHQAFHDMAHDLVDTLPKNPERAHCLRALLQAKDCAVRSALTRTD